MFWSVSFSYLGLTPRASLAQEPKGVSESPSTSCYIIQTVWLRLLRSCRKVMHAPWCTRWDQV